MLPSAMNTNSLRNVLVLAASILLGSLTAATAAPRSYKAEQVTIKKVEPQKNATIKITYSTMAETMYFCPGANSTTTDKGVELSFPRAYFKSRAKAEHPGTPIKDSFYKTVIIPTEGKPVFIKNGKKPVQIHPPKAAK